MFQCSPMLRAKLYHFWVVYISLSGGDFDCIQRSQVQVLISAFFFCLGKNLFIHTQKNSGSIAEDKIASDI